MNSSFKRPGVSGRSPAPMKKSPILTDKLLRHPGQSLDEMRWNFITDKFVSPFFYIAGFLALGLWEILRWIFNVTSPSLSVIIMSIGVIIFCSFRVYRMRNDIKSMRLGSSGEKAVGQYLDAYIKGPNTFVFHDVCSEKANVDHVIVSTKGIYTVETKTYSKPEFGETIIEPTEDGLVINRGKPFTAPLIQSLAQTRWLKTLLKERTGKTFPVQPIVVFPGWFVKPNRTQTFAKIWILNPKMLPIQLADRNASLSVDQVQEIARQLRRYIGEFKVEI